MVRYGVIGLLSDSLIKPHARTKGVRKVWEKAVIHASDNGSVVWMVQSAHLSRTTVQGGIQNYNAMAYNIA